MAAMDHIPPKVGGSCPGKWGGGQDKLKSSLKTSFRCEAERGEQLANNRPKCYCWGECVTFSRSLEPETACIIT